HRLHPRDGATNCRGSSSGIVIKACRCHHVPVPRVWAPALAAMAALLALGIWLMRDAGVGWHDGADAPVAAAGLVLAFTFAKRRDESWRLMARLVLGFTVIQLSDIAATGGPVG